MSKMRSLVCMVVAVVMVMSVCVPLCAVDVYIMPVTYTDTKYRTVSNRYGSDTIQIDIEYTVNVQNDDFLELNSYSVYESGEGVNVDSLTITNKSAEIDRTERTITISFDVMLKTFQYDDGNTYTYISYHYPEVVFSY